MRDAPARVRNPVPQSDGTVDDLGLEDLVEVKLRAFLRKVDGYPIAGLYDEVIARVERPLLALVLEYTGGNQLRAAQVLGLNRNTLRKKIAEHRLVVDTGRVRG